MTSLLSEFAGGSFHLLLRVFVIVVPIMVVLELFEGSRPFRRLVRLWARLMAPLGMTEEIATPTFVGFLFGIAYGSGVIIRETRRRHIARRQVFLMSVFLSQVHAIVEDSLVFVALGAAALWVVGFRLLWAAAATALLGAVVTAGASPPRGGATEPRPSRVLLTRLIEFLYESFDVNISAKSKYAVRALVELAERTQARPDRLVRLTDVAAARGIPLQFLEQLFASLRRAGIVRSRRGASGGFVFARPPADITVLEVVETLDGLVSPAVCTQGECERLEECGPAAVWLEAKEALEQVLRQTTIGDLVGRERARAPHEAMYYI